jgi:proline iminopeptidase
MQHLRNLIIRLTVTYIVLLSITALPGIQSGDTLFGLWIASLAFVLLTAFVRPVLMALTLPFTIMSAGLFIFVIDGVLLLLTDLLTGLEIAGFGWAILGSVVMSIMNIWVQSAFKRLGWMQREDEDDPQEILSPGWLLRTLLGLGLLVGLFFSGLTAFQVMLALSTVTGNLTLLGGVALVTFFLISLGVAWLVAEGLETRNRARFSAVVSVLATTLATVATLLIVSQPIAGVKAPAPTPDPAPRYWTLETGSRIAYYYYPAVEASDAPPIVYLHDGPGLAVLPAERDFYSRLAQDGFDVYLYDQVGTGQSARLDEISAYGMERNIADLDAIRSELGVNELILIGQGAGAELAARYLGHYPERVNRAIFLAPTPLWHDEQFFYTYARTGSAIGPNPVLEPRLLLATVLAAYGPEAAQNLASQEQMRVMAARTFSPQTWVCARHSDRAPDVGAAQFNYYVQLQTELSAEALPDPRPRLADNLTPSLILAGECDYIPWGVVLQYRETLLNDVVFYVEDAGHMLPQTRPEYVHELLRAFLLDQLYPAEPYTGTTNPRPQLVP